jgi:hypothetical protein
MTPFDSRHHPATCHHDIINHNNDMSPSDTNHTLPFLSFSLSLPLSLPLSLSLSISLPLTLSCCFSLFSLPLSFLSQMYADNQDEFFKDYEEAHVRMAHIGCEFCGPNSHLKIDTCA